MDILHLGESARALKQTKSMVTCAMLLAVQVVLNTFVSVYITQNIRISFGFLAVAATACLYGAVPAMLNAAAADIIGYIIKPAGPYFPGFTISAILGAAIYSIAFYKKDIKLIRVLASKLAIDLFVNLLLNSLWLKMLYGTAFFAMLPARAIKNAMQYPIDAALLLFVMLAVKRFAAGKAMITG